MIDEITLMKYADGTLTSEEKKEVEKEIQNNPEYLKIISNFKKSRDILLDVSEDIKSEELPNSIKEIHKKINKKENLALFSLLNNTKAKIIASVVAAGAILVLILSKARIFFDDFIIKFFDNLINYLPI